MYRYLIFPFCVFCIISCQPHDKPPVEKGPTIGMEDNNIRNYLVRVAGEITDNALKDINSPGDWEEVRDRKLQEFLEMIRDERAASVRQAEIDTQF